MGPNADSFLGAGAGAVEGKHSEGKSADDARARSSFASPSEEKSSGQRDRDRVDDYRMFLSGVCADGSMSSREQEILAKYRRAHDVTDAEHVAVLQKLGISQGDFRMLASDDVRGAETERAPLALRVPRCS